MELLHELTLGTNRMNKIFQILFFLVFIGCATNKSEKLQSNSTINSIFNKKESQDLQKILDFFENSICVSENIKKENINVCYKKYFERLKQESEKNGNIYLKIPIDEQLKVYKNFKDSTFKEIWQLGKFFPLNTTTDTLKYYSYNFNGKYLEYLKELGKTNKAVDNYTKSFLNAGDMPPSMWASVLMDYENYNIKDIRVKLFLAIHYLTLNDQNEREEKY